MAQVENEGQIRKDGKREIMIRFHRNELYKVVQTLKMAYLANDKELVVALTNFLLSQTKPETVKVVKGGKSANQDKVV